MSKKLDATIAFHKAILTKVIREPTDDDALRAIILSALSPDIFALDLLPEIAAAPNLPDDIRDMARKALRAIEGVTAVSQPARHAIRRQ